MFDKLLSSPSSVSLVLYYNMTRVNTHWRKVARYLEFDTSQGWIRILTNSIIITGIILVILYSLQYHSMLPALVIFRTNPVTNKYHR